MIYNFNYIPMLYVNYLFKFLLFSVLLINLKGCFYSFTGASVAAHLNSVAIPVFDDRSNFVEAGLKENFTNRLIQKFLDDNTLQVAEKVNADAILEGSIITVTDNPVVVSQGDRGENVSARRITITVKVVFRDLVKKQIVSDKNYSNYGDYETTDFTEGRNSAFQTAVDRITDDILLGTVSNW